MPSKNMIPDKVFRSPYSEALRQLGAMKTLNDSPFTHEPAAGYMRGIDFYKASTLPSVLAKSIHYYYKVHRTLPDIMNPVGFNEKILWSKFFSEFKVPESGNKLLTAQFIPKKLQSEISCPEIVWHSESSKLPNNNEIASGYYYLKANHGSALLRKIQYPLSQQDRIVLEALCTRWLNYPYGKDWGEWWYNVFPRELIIERSVNDDFSTPAWGMYVFGNQVPFIVVMRKSVNGLDTVWLDGQGKKLPFQEKRGKKSFDYEIPESFPFMTKAAVLIGARFKFARIDFLIGSDGAVYLGEVTFAPGNGSVLRPTELDTTLGRLWKHSL